MNDILRAINFASEAHKRQVRKYSLGLTSVSSTVPYIVHPIRVYTRIAERYPELKSVHIAAILHDTVEDTDVKPIDIFTHFGSAVEWLVSDVTNVFTSEDYPHLNRADRKKREFQRISKIPFGGKLIKLYDRIDNLSEMPIGEEFTNKYIHESRDLLEVLRGTDQVVENELDNVIQDVYNQCVQAKLADKLHVPINRHIND